MLHVIGIGPGQSEWLPQAIHNVVAKCNVIIGSSRALQLFPYLKIGQYHLSGNIVQSLQLIEKFLHEGLIVGVLVSGDPGFYSFLSALRREFPEEQIVVHPGISSLQFAFAKAGLSWHEATFVSVHGRELANIPRIILKPTAVLTGGENTPQKVAQLLLERGINPTISVGNALGYPDETWDTMDTEHLARYSKPLTNAIMIIYPLPRQLSWQNNIPCIGIPDSEFIRGEVPMTKAEIRVQILAKARISTNDHVLDIGSGTGSIAIEAAALAHEGIVYAIDNDPEAQQLIRENQRKFAVPNLQLIKGTAPDVFPKIPPVDVCIIGGSKGRLPEIVRQAPLVEGGRLVISAITLENVTKGLEILESLNYQDIDTVSIQAVRWPKVNKLHMAQSLNQVFIISARKGV